MEGGTGQVAVPGVCVIRGGGGVCELTSHLGVARAGEAAGDCCGAHEAGPQQAVHRTQCLCSTRLSGRTLTDACVCVLCGTDQSG